MNASFPQYIITLKWIIFPVHFDNNRMPTYPENSWYWFQSQKNLDYIVQKVSWTSNHFFTNRMGCWIDRRTSSAIILFIGPQGCVLRASFTKSKIYGYICWLLDFICNGLTPSHTNVAGTISALRVDSRSYTREFVAPSRTVRVGTGATRNIPAVLNKLFEGVLHIIP